MADEQIVAAGRRLEDVILAILHKVAAILIDTLSSRYVVVVVVAYILLEIETLNIAHRFSPSSDHVRSLSISISMLLLLLLNR